jgi:hypothetical protein
VSKVVITQEQKEVLLYILNIYSSEDIVRKHASANNFWLNQNWSELINVECLNQLSVDEVIKALYVGYEVIKTPQETLLECHNGYLDHSQREYSFNVDEKRGFRIGIAVACFVLGEKIAGITE